MSALSRLFKIVSVCIALSIAACGGPEGAGALYAAAAPGDYASTYTGTVTGTTDTTESGTLSLTINSSGDVTGAAIIKSTSYPLSGTVDAEGKLSLHLYANIGVAHNWTGTVVKSTGKISGTWRYAWSGAAVVDGTFEASKVK